MEPGGRVLDGNVEAGGGEAVARQAGVANQRRTAASVPKESHVPIRRAIRGGGGIAVRGGARREVGGGT